MRRRGTTVPSPLTPAKRRVWWRPRLLAVVVTVAGLVLSVVLSWLAATANAHENSRLLNLQAREAASSLTASLSPIQSQLGAALTLATTTNSPATFTRFASGRLKQSGFVSESLWERPHKKHKKLTVVAIAGSMPQLIKEGEARKFLSKLRPSTLLRVNRIVTGSLERIGFADYPPGDTRYIAYGEIALPAGKPITYPASSPFADLNFVVYLGRTPSPWLVVATSLSTSMTAAALAGTHATVSVPFGDSVFTIVATPAVPLTGWVSRALPWMAFGIGAAIALSAGVIAEFLGRRRDLAEDMGAELTRLYAEERSVAQSLQHHLLPERLPSVDGMELAARYFAGSEGVDIGGDWYDVVVLDNEHLAFIVGDVSGRGVKAATVMATLRFAARGFALEGHSPSGILGQLAKTLNFATDGHFATVLCGTVDIPRHEVLLANAGHPPPLVRSNGTATVLDVPPTAPIGMARAAPAEYGPWSVPNGGTLIAYTDGLIEQRREDVDEAIERLRKSAGQDAPTLDGFIDSVVSDLTGGVPEDDVAILALRWMN